MYLLDTNIVSHIFRKNSHVLNRLSHIHATEVCISCITEAELRYGVKKRQNKALTVAVNEFLRLTEVLAWESRDAEIYGVLRADMEKKGHVMGCMDMLIATHAVSRQRIIVTNDSAFRMVKGLTIEDWTCE